APREAPLGVPGADDRLGVLRVVDEPDLLEAVEDRQHDVLRVALAREGLRELGATLRRGREDAEHGLARPLGEVGVADLSPLHELVEGRARAPPGRAAGATPVVVRGGRLAAVGPAPLLDQNGDFFPLAAPAVAFAAGAASATVTPAAGSAGASTLAPTPSFSLIFFSSSLARSGLSRRNARAFSLPWPSWSPPYVNHDPDLRTNPCSTPMSMRPPSREMPTP